jgi:hypothetical protein
MFGHCSYSVSCIPMQELLICQLRCGKLLLVGPLRPVGSQAQCVILDMRCTAGVVRLLLRVVPPTVELSLRPLLRQLS